MKTFILALLLVSTPTFADEWSRADIYRETTYLAIDAIDLAQTHSLARQQYDARYTKGYQYIERNPILGEHPSVDRVDAYFALTALAHVGITHLLPAKWRAPWQYVTIGFEGGLVAHNYSIGVSAKF